MTSADGAKKKDSSGQFEFVRPEPLSLHLLPSRSSSRSSPTGRRSGLYDVDLNQVTVRPMAQALGATPAALLAGGTLDKEFELKALPASDGLEWVQAHAAREDGPIPVVARRRSRARTLAALEIVDAFWPALDAALHGAGAKHQAGGRDLSLHAAARAPT